MSKPVSPPIVKCARGLLREIERAVTTFPRRYKYSLGQDLRDGAIRAALLSQDAFRASRRPERCAELVGQLSEVIDAINLRLQISYELQAWPSFDNFNAVAGIANELGRQCGAWHRSITKHLSGQNPQASAPRECAGTLSTRAAPEANA